MVEEEVYKYLHAVKELSEEGHMAVEEVEEDNLDLDKDLEAYKY